MESEGEPSAHRSSEGAVVELVEAGSSFEGFVSAEYERLHAALYVITGSREEAADCAQEAFVRLWERWERVRAMERPTGYLFRVALNESRSRRRRLTRWARIQPGLESPRSYSVTTVEDRDEAWRILGLLSPRQRAVLVLTGYLGFTTEETAEALGIAVATVRSTASQARAAAARSVRGSTDD